MSDIWTELQPFAIDPDRLSANKVITAAREHPAHVAFDVLRTRLMQVMEEKGWTRLAITSPTPDCGKSFVCANLAVALSRYSETRSVLLDLDLRRSSQHHIFGVERAGSMGDFLRGKRAVEEQFRVPGPNRLHIGPSLAIGFNARREDYAAELLHDPLTEEVIDQLEDNLTPDIMLFDTAPVLNNDDVLAMRPWVDAFLVVAGGGLTRARELKLLERQLGEGGPILGVVLNRAEGPTLAEYYY